MRWYQWMLCLMSLMGSEVASAQPRSIDVPATARWQHARSGAVLPTRIGDFVRTRIEEYAPNEVDVAAQYDGPAGRLSIYLFRPQTADVGVWFDRAVTSLGANPLLQGLTPVTPQPEMFAPQGGTVASGLRQIFRASGRFSHSAVALFPTGNWLVKIRLSAVAQDDAAVAAVLDRAIAAVRLRQNVTVSLAARVVQPCPTPRTWRRARAVNTSGGRGLEALLGGIALSVTETPEAGASAPTGLRAPALCRDDTAVDAGSVYRNPEWDHGYWIALGDSGTILAVEPDVMGELLGDRPSSQATATLRSPLETMTFGVFNRLPTPQQVLQSSGGGGMRLSTPFDPEAESAAAPPAPPAPAASPETPPQPPQL